MLRREYFDCPQRDSHAVHYIQKRGEWGVCTLVLCSLATVMSCIDASVRIVIKSPHKRRVFNLTIEADPEIVHAGKILAWGKFANQ